MNLREDHVRLPDGHEMEEYHILEYPDWVCVVCLTSEHEIVMVEQYRYGIDEVTLELPGGAVDPDEDPGAAAARELLEEAGYVADPDSWKLVGKIAPDPSRHTNWAWIYFAKDAHKAADQNLDPGEDMKVKLVDVRQALTAADEGRLAHGIHLAALLWAHRLGLLE